MYRNGPRQIVVTEIPARTMTKQTLSRRLITYLQDYNSTNIGGYFTDRRIVCQKCLFTLLLGAADQCGSILKRKDRTFPNTNLLRHLFITVHFDSVTRETVVRVNLQGTTPLLSIQM